MFSEYASRFLAQSQSRLSNFGQPDAEPSSSRQPAEPSTRFPRNPARPGYQSRLGNPYQPSGSRFGFASRYHSSQDTAPLFHSALNEFQDEDEDDAREATDFRALQRSRRVFISGRIDESSASENDNSHASLGESGEQDSRVYEDRGKPLGIKSSWNGESSFKDRPLRLKKKEEVKIPGEPKPSRHNSDSSDGKMEDIRLESTVLDNEVPEDLLQETPTDNDPPAFQQFRSSKAGHEPRLEPRLMRQVIPEEDEDLEETGPTVPSIGAHAEMFQNDQFFAWIYLIAIASLFATFVLVWLHTSTPSSKTPLGDTIYTTLHSSFYLLAVDTVIAVVVALVWMALLRSFVRPLVMLIVVGSPIVLFAFSLYPFISSFQGSSRLATQDTVMRWLSIIPAAAAVVMVWLINRARYQLRKAIELLEFASKILAANPALIMLGFGSLVFVIGWTWIWLGMFTRVFLSGYFSKSIAAFVIGAATWWIGVYFFLMYLWTLSVGSGVVRATTAGTVSNWYFHRNRQPPSPSNAVVSEALQHATNSTFGTICAATLLQLGVRVPLLVLPARLARIVNLAAFSLIPAPIVILTNPLVLTYAAIHSVPLMESASRLTRMPFLNMDSTTTALMPVMLKTRNPNLRGLIPYSLAKLLLNATKMVMSAALGFAGWVMTARQLEGQRPDGVGFRGSAYAYVVGIVAGAIGFSILGSLESILVGILDAVVVCYGSERRLGSGRTGYCMEAAYLFGDNDDDERGVV